MAIGWDSEQDPVSTAGFDTCDRVLYLVGDRGEALVTRSRGRSALTRFANSRIHQNVDGEVEHVRLQVVVAGGRTAQATTTRVDSDGLSRLVEGAIAAARLLPADLGFPALAEPAELAEVDHFAIRLFSNLERWLRSCCSLPGSASTARLTRRT